jgi:hypothetical protein
MWQCPKCKREFQKTNQSHSCAAFPLEKHFEGKEKARELFDYLKSQIEKHVGLVKIESLPCCIHFVSSYSFGACWALKDKIRIDFRVDHPIETKREHKLNQMSANRFLYYFDIYDKSEIDLELLGWIKESYGLND